MSFATYSKRDVVQHDVKPRCASHQVIPNQPRDILTLCDELTGVELCDDALQHLVHDAGKHALVVVGSKSSVDLREGVYPWTGQDTAGDINHLQILRTGEGGDVARFRAHVVVDGCLEPGDLDVCSFAVDFLSDT